MPKRTPIEFGEKAVATIAGSPAQLAKKSKELLRLRPSFSPRRSPIGATPGVLHGTSTGNAPPLDVIAWDGDGQVHAFEAEELQQAADALESYRYVWLNIRGNSHLQTLEEVRRVFDLHALAVEDAWNVPQRSKLDGYERHLFLVLNHLALASEEDVPEEQQALLQAQQISFFIGERYLITIQENNQTLFEPIRKRFLDPHGQMKKRTPDYVAYALADAVVDSCFPLLDTLAEQVETAESSIYVRKHRGVITHLLSLRRRLHELKRLVTPMHRALTDLLTLDSSLIHKATRVYLRDCVDHATRLVESAEVAQDHAKSLMDVHIALSSHEMNEVMKVLTIISTIFIPLSFIAGVYGMNFDPEVSPWNMPELSWFFGYPFALLLMLTVGVGFAFYFRARRWF